MKVNAELIFREEQTFSKWLCWLVYLSMGLAVLLSVVGLQKEFSEQGPPEALDVFLAVIVGIGVPIAIGALFYLLKLETEVRPDGLYIRFFPFHIRFKKFSPEDLSEYYARQYKPIREYGGWGIRCGLFGKGKAYNVSGNQGVQLVFKNGKKLLIGSQRPQELEQAIHSMVKS